MATGLCKSDLNADIMSNNVYAGRVEVRSCYASDEEEFPRDPM